MATRRELQMLACLRLKEAEALYAASCYDGWAYLCGYVVELALKAAICANLEVDEYPEARLRGGFRTHDFDDLKLLAGMEQVFASAGPTLLVNWSVASQWRPERRYQVGSCNQPSALRILDALRDYPGGVLACISIHW